MRPRQGFPLSVPLVNDRRSSNHGLHPAGVHLFHPLLEGPISEWSGAWAVEFRFQSGRRQKRSGGQWPQGTRAATRETVTDFGTQRCH